ncbi:MAG: histidine--tRNA ligase [Bacilli bacterium]|nr:histidine--tRNA ligase [Bacilli bacterium]
MSIINVKGTHDIIGKESELFHYVESLMRLISKQYAFSEVRPPVLEHSELFVRGVGESSDVVRKEMYTFLDKGERSLTLRPEFTAGIMRLIVQNKLYATNDLPLKYFYLGPVFRYERPQLGRYRQFNQFGVECVGGNSYFYDVETISLAYDILKSLKLNNVVIKINTLGDEESRNNYRLALKEFFKEHIIDMCEDCKQRYELNPLRILDCKVPEDQEIVKNAPKMSDYLTNESKERFQRVLSALEQLEIPYIVDDGLVRGLDYYSETVFEFHYTSQNGNNYGAIGAGGHYSHLVKEVGGPDIPGIGFSFGVERIVSVLKDDNILNEEKIDDRVDFYVMPIGEENLNYAYEIARKIRHLDFSVDICLEKAKVPAMFKRAEKKNVRFAIIIGENEVKERKIIIKNLASQQQIELSEDKIFSDIYDIYDQCFSCDGDCENCR